MLFDALKSYKTVIWDWNGTLVDDVRLTHDVANKTLSDLQLEKIDFDTYRKKMRFPIKDFYVDIGIDLETHCFESLSNDFIKEYESRLMAEAKVFEGRHDLLMELKQAGTTHLLLSAAPHKHLVPMVERFGLSDVFDDISGAEDAFAHGKVERAKSMLAKHTLEKDNTALVGDTLHDLEVGQAIGVEVWLLSQGHQCPQMLKNAHKNVL